MLDYEYEKEVLKIPVPDNTVSRGTQNMSPDAEPQVIANSKGADFFFFCYSVERVK
jgi:hypothetical protein